MSRQAAAGQGGIKADSSIETGKRTGSKDKPLGCASTQGCIHRAQALNIHGGVTGYRECAGSSGIGDRQRIGTEVQVSETH